MTLTELLITITLERNQFILQIYLVYNTCAHQTILFGYRYRCLQNKFRVHVYTKPVCSTGVHKTSLQYMCTQNQFAVQVCSKPVYSTCVHKTGLKYRCTQNQFTVQVNLKPVYSTCIHKTKTKVSSSKIFFLLYLQIFDLSSFWELSKCLLFWDVVFRGVL